MNFLENILRFLDGQMTTPTPYRWFHLLCFALIIASTIFIVAKYKNADDKKNRKILLTFAIIMLTLEVFKQLNFSFNSATGIWDYQWYAFPFQFCSVPMYVFLIAALIKSGRVQDSLFAFLGTYALFAGLAVMLYPNTVFISTIGINIQTMVHHGLMLVGGVYILASGRAKLNYKTVLKALPVFVVCVLLAIGMNYLTHFLGLTETFNMFFISEYFDNHLPVLNVVYDTAPYLVFLAVYVFGFTLVAYIILMCAKVLAIVNKMLLKNFKKFDK